VLVDPTGYVDPETGKRRELWSSDCPPADSLAGLAANLIQAGWTISTMLKLPNEDEEILLGDLYFREFGRHVKNHAQFQRAAQIADRIANSSGGWWMS
jgi:hypothetical protein